MSLLFVEDDGDDVELALLGFRLQKFEIPVVVAKDGKDALDLLIADCEAARLLPRAILTDIKMPRMDGLELLRRIKSDPRLKEIPVAIFTSSDHEADRNEAMSLGAACYLMKPSDLDDYAGIVKSLRELMEPGASASA
ncbi:MAG: response regulator [Elusimicrobiota bacterium]|nr:response regulator [Elusimicrobiota bacterium]